MLLPFLNTGKIHVHVVVKQLTHSSIYINNFIQHYVHPLTLTEIVINT